jgi:hypothetical protein
MPWPGPPPRTHAHTGMPLWDQRLVYNHAVLAHIGRPVMLLMADLDEFVSPLNPKTLNPKP